MPGISQANNNISGRSVETEPLRPLDSLFFGIQKFLGDIYWAVLALLEGSPHIFADDADAEQLDTAQQQYQYDDGGIAGNIDAPDQLFEDYPDQVQDGSNGGQTADVDGIPQGSGGETDDAFYGVICQLSEAPFRLSGVALAGGVGDKAGVIAHPREQALGEPVVFRQFQQTVAYTAAEGAEIAGIGVEIHVRQVIDDVVKPLLEERKHFSLATAVLISGDNIVFRLFVQNFNHFQNDFRLLLKIRIDQSDILTAGVLHPGVDGRFLAEVSGEGNDLYRAYLRFIQFFQVVKCSVLAAVIDEYDLIIIAAAVKGGNDRRLKRRHILRFIVAGDYKGKFHGNQLAIVNYGLLYDKICIQSRIVSVSLELNLSTWVLSQKKGDLSAVQEEFYLVF